MEKKKMNFKKNFTKEDYIFGLKKSRSIFFGLPKKEQKNVLEKLNILKNWYDDEITYLKKMPTNQKMKKGVEKILIDKEKKLNKDVFEDEKRRKIILEIENLIFDTFKEKNIENLNSAQTTSSVYFEYKNKKIRVSNHSKREFKRKSFIGILKSKVCMDFDYNIEFNYWDNKSKKTNKMLKELFVNDLKI